METSGTATAEIVTPQPILREEPRPMEPATDSSDPGYLPQDNELLLREDPRRAQLLADIRSGNFSYAPGAETEKEGMPLAAGIGLAVGAFALVGLFLWGSQRVVNYAGGMRQSLSHGASREVSYVEPDASTVPTSGARLPNPSARTGVTFRPIYNRAPPPPVPAHVGKGPFISPAAQEAARQAVKPLHDLASLVQKFDGSVSGVAVSPAAPAATGPVAPVTLTGPSGPGGVGGGGQAYAASRGALFAAAPPGGGRSTAYQNSATVEHVAMQADALSAQVSLLTHEEMYPEPLRPSVRELSREMHGYIMDNQMAAGGGPDSGNLRSAAGKRMNRAQALLSYMDGIVSGNTDPNVTQMP